MDIKKITESINILCDNLVDEVAIVNMLNAKLMQLMTFKGVKFESIENMDRPLPPSYYAFNFVPSGGLKNKLLMEIDRLVPFANDIIKNYNESRLKDLEHKHYQELLQLSPAEQKQLKKEQNLEKKAFKKLYLTVSDATQASIYNSMNIIKDTGYGSMYLENTEFANYFEDAFVGRDKTKKEFLDMLFNLYDGEFNGTNTMTTSRENIKGISVSLGLMSDYKLILENSNLSKMFKSYLIRGMARRSFIYFSDKANCFNDDPHISSVAEKEWAIAQIKIASEELKGIYDRVKFQGKYFFNSESNEYINSYKMEVARKVRKFYENTDYLDDDMEILKLTIQHSTWKIIKLAVLYHLLDNPESPLIKVESFRKAEEFYNQIFNCLEVMVNKNSMSDYDKLYAYLVRRKNKWVSRTDLRNQKIVQSRDFGKWIEQALAECSEVGAKNGLILVGRNTGKNNSGYDVCLYEGRKYKYDDKINELCKIDNSDRLVEVL